MYKGVVAHFSVSCYFMKLTAHNRIEVTAIAYGRIAFQLENKIHIDRGAFLIGKVFHEIHSARWH